MTSSRNANNPWMSGDHRHITLTRRTNDYWDDDDDGDDGGRRVITVDSLRSQLRRLTVVYAWHAWCQPFVVASTLLQVQHLPRIRRDIEVGGEFMDRDTADLDGPFQALRRQSVESMDKRDDDEESTTFPWPRPLHAIVPPAATLSRNSGYQPIATTSLSSENLVEDTRPSYELPPLHLGVWSSVRAIRRSRAEGGWSSGWKGIIRGLWTGFVRAQLAESGAAFLEDTLNDQFELYDPTIIPFHLQENFWPNMTTAVVGRVVASIVLSPVEAVETRLIVQSRQQPTYRGALSTLMALANETEAGSLPTMPSSRSSPRRLLSHISALYPHLTLTAIYHLLDVVLFLGPRVLIQRWWRVSFHRHPMWFAGLSFACEMGKQVVMVPMDTVRKRLQAQHRGNHNVCARCIRISNVPYAGFWDCMKRIVREEAVGSSVSTSAMSIPRKYARSSYRDGWIGGLIQLYRPFGFRVAIAFLHALATAVVSFNFPDELDHYYYYF